MADLKVDNAGLQDLLSSLRFFADNLPSRAGSAQPMAPFTNGVGGA